jgi:adenine-specific DNA-methyltransferase
VRGIVQERASLAVAIGSLPTTRYRGSKRRHSESIGAALSRARPTRLFDAFGGSGIVSIVADQLGIGAQYSDLYRWSTTCARTLLVNSYDQRDLETALTHLDSAFQFATPGFITSTFHGCYFTRPENIELDAVLRLLKSEKRPKIRDLIFFGIAQASLAKLPMSMFHRACLAQRTASVPHRSGNLTTWNTPFRILAPRFIQEAVLFTWRRRMRHVVVHASASSAVPRLTTGEALFLDPPYVNAKGNGPTYGEAYHFLEGFSVGEEAWADGIDPDASHPVFSDAPSSEFEDRRGWTDGLSGLATRGEAATILATARERDHPGARELYGLLRERFGRVRREKIASRTIFSDAPNSEFLFVAS